MVDLLRRAFTVTAVFVALICSASSGRSQPSTEYARSVRTVAGLTVYLGVIPAEVLKGHSMHGGTPAGVHQYHFVAAIFDAASGSRVTDATVTAKVSGLGLSGVEKALEPMNTEHAFTFGGFFDLPGADLYALRLMVRRPSSPDPLAFDFKYDHRYR
jgi:hypothetical protein